jgi:hypothetical protein
VKRTPKPSGRKAAQRSPKLPDELLPIVDSVVEVVFERLRSATKTKVLAKAPSDLRKTAKLNLPLPRQRTALAEALADLLLADLASGAKSSKSKRRRRRGARRTGGRATALPKRRSPRV